MGHRKSVCGVCVCGVVCCVVCVTYEHACAESTVLAPNVHQSSSCVTMHLCAKLFAANLLLQCCCLLLVHQNQTPEKCDFHQLIINRIMFLWVEAIDSL